jgi:hypothetical protein
MVAINVRKEKYIHWVQVSLSIYILTGALQLFLIASVVTTRICTEHDSEPS